MPSHIMLSYQWDDQAVVKKIFDHLKEDGLPVWMDIEGGVTGNIHNVMAAGVEQAVVVCPFLTPAYQASRSCKKELSHADSCQVPMVPVILTNNWEPSEWLGLMTAGLLCVDFRNAATDEERFEVCLHSLKAELLFTTGNMITVKQTEEEAQEQLKRRPGRGFCHALSELYICDTAEQLPESDFEKTPVGLTHFPARHCYWEEVKCQRCKFYRNIQTKRYLSHDPISDQVFLVSGQSKCEEWILLMDQSDHSTHRAVIIKNKNSGQFLAIQDGGLVGRESYNEDCKWFLN